MLWVPDCATFEYHDYPRDKDRLWSVVSRLRSVRDDLKVSLFAIVDEMTADDWRFLESRRSWVEVNPHGFTHSKRECRDPLVFELNVDRLDALAEDDRWGKLFCAPMFGHSARFLAYLAERGFAYCTTSLRRHPFPMPASWRLWSNFDARWGAAEHWRRFALWHPVYAGVERIRCRRSELNPKSVYRHIEAAGDLPYRFVSELIRPACLKLSLGCGPHVWDGWCCLDPRSDLDDRIVEWDFSRRIPFGDNKADVVLTSHVFNYLDESEYASALLEIWRVLRPGGIVRLSEDAGDSGYVWRRPGQGSRGTGVIKSIPSRAKIIAALERVGFRWFDAQPGKTRSPHKDVLLGDSRHRRYRLGHKFYLEALKDIRIPDESRSRWYDPRAQRDGTYRLPEPEELEVSSV